jgi:hypothetical protein
MRKLFVLALVFAILFAGCISVPSGTKGTSATVTGNTVPATSGGSTSGGDELPPLPPDEEAVADTTTTLPSDELPPLPE